MMIAIMQLVNLDILHTQKLLYWVFDFEEREPFNERFSMSGYSTTNFIIELGPINIIVLAWLLLIILRLAILYCLTGIKC